ncbi:MAG: molybdopterin-dependent oxidoreductase [Hyphomonas sp.]|uniref:nitrate reductase n=1 Tax=Hyphomonas sp. TaxID=87 RepID=UPI003002940F
MIGRTTSKAEIATTCPYCGVGCGVLVKTPGDAVRAEVRGDPDHPSNKGRLCSKGSALGETIDLDERLLAPVVDGLEVEWDEAIARVADGFSTAIAEHGPDSVAFYVSGQFLTEDYYVANKLMKGFIGSANIDTNSRLCMASSVVGHKRAFGADTVPGCYEDLELADLVVMVGSNFAWCHPVLHQRLLEAQSKRGTRIVVIDPRRTATTEAADLHLPIRAGADVRLFNALFAHLARSAARDDTFIEDHTRDLNDALLQAGDLSLTAVSEQTGIPEKDLRTFFEWVEKTERTLTIYSQGVNQSSDGSDKVNAILNTHLVTGRIGRPGMGPFSITGQPNAMGGREVGGLANQLVAHMDFAPADVDRVERFWKVPVIAQRPGLKAVDMFDAVADGRIKAIWIMATNPVVSMPDADRVRAALKACPLVVVSEVVSTSDTVQLADIALPATAWGEKSGTVTNSERRISRQRSFLRAPGEARHDWQALCDVANRMGFVGFDFESPAQIFAEYAALSAFENAGTRDFDIGAYAGLGGDAYDALLPFQWPQPALGQRAGRGGTLDHRFFADGRFYTHDGRACFVPTPPGNPAAAPDATFPFVMNTGRVRDHWHSMTRTGKTPRLSSHMAEPFVEIHPADANHAGIGEAALVRVTSRHGEAVLRALITDRVKKGEVFVPIHWTDRYSAQARVDALVAPHVDPHSGQPEFKFTPVHIASLAPAWFGFGVFADEPGAEQLSKFDYWALARAPGGWRLEFAGTAAIDDAATALIAHADAVSLGIGESGVARAQFDGARLIAMVKLSARGPVVADRSWLAGQLTASQSLESRFAILAGRPPGGEVTGRIVCSCLGVGMNVIRAAVLGGAANDREIGAVTGAGTNCGSCKPELRAILESLRSDVGLMEEVAAE